MDKHVIIKNGAFYIKFLASNLSICYQLFPCVSQIITPKLDLVNIYKLSMNKFLKFFFLIALIKAGILV